MAIAGGSILTGLSVSWALSNGLNAAWIIAGLALMGGLLIYLLETRFVIRALLLMVIATTSLGAYELPLVGDYSLQMMRVVLLVAFIAWFPLGLRGKLRLSAPAALAFALFVYAAVSTALLSRDLANSVSITVALLFGSLYLLWLPNVLQDRETARYVISGLYVAGFVLLAFGVYQFLAWFIGFGRDGFQFVIPFADFLGMEAQTVTPSRIGPLFRVTLPHSSSSFVAPNIAAILLVIIALRMDRQSTGRRAWLGLAVISALFALLVLTYSRAAWLGFVAGFLIIVLYLRTTLLPRHILAGFFLVMIIVIGALLAAPELFGTVALRFDPQSTASSDELHAQFVVDASRLWSTRPIFGYGVGNYKTLTGILHAHNAYATNLVEGGLVFLFLNLAWVASVIALAHRTIERSRTTAGRMRPLAVGLFAAYISFLVDNLFQMTWYLGVFWLLAGLITAMYYNVKTPSDPGEKRIMRTTDEYQA